MSPRSQAFGLRLALLVSIVTPAACVDRVAAPPPQVVPVPRHDFLGDANWGQHNSAQSGAWDGDVIDSVYGGFPGPAQPLGPFPYPTFIRVAVSGTVAQVPGAFPGTHIVRTAYAAAGDPYFWGAIGFVSNGDLWFALAPETILRVVAPITPFRSDAGGQPMGDWSHCGVPGYALCWTWAGSAHLSFERLAADLTLSQSPATPVWAGQAVTFTAAANPATVPGNPWPIGVEELQWRWIPDDTASADTLGCGSTSGSKCTRVMRGAGTMYAAAYVNGLQQQQKSVHVVVQVPELYLSASKSVLAAPGENDTFTATANGALTVLGWSFTPDGASLNRLEATPVAIAARTAKARPANNAVRGQSATTRRLEVPSTSRRLASSGSAWDTCVSGATQCTNLVTESGTVDVLAIVNGDTLRASVAVLVVPCPLLGDSLLNVKVVRDGLGLLMDKSTPADPTARREHTAWIYRDTLTGAITFAEYPSDRVPTGCSVVQRYVPGPPNTVILAGVHSHPFAAGDSVPPNVCPKAKRGGTGTSQPSPSDDTIAANSGTPQYIVDRDSIYRTLGPGKRTSWSRAQPGCADIIPPKPIVNSIPFDLPVMREDRSRNYHRSHR